MSIPKNMCAVQFVKLLNSRRVLFFVIFQFSKSWKFYRKNPRIKMQNMEYYYIVYIRTRHTTVSSINVLDLLDSNEKYDWFLPICSAPQTVWISFGNFAKSSLA